MQSPSEDVRKSSFHYLFKQITNLFEQIDSMFRNKKNTPYSVYL